MRTSFCVIVYSLSSITSQILLAICNWIQTEWFNLYCEYTYEKKEKPNMAGDNTRLCVFSKEYKLTLNVSDVGVLLQEGKHDIYLPNCYFSFKFWQRSEKIIHNWKKKTCLIVILEALWCTLYPFVVLTDHNTVTFIN